MSQINLARIWCHPNNYQTDRISSLLSKCTPSKSFLSNINSILSPICLWLISGIICPSLWPCMGLMLSAYENIRHNWLWPWTQVDWQLLSLKSSDVGHSVRLSHITLPTALISLTKSFSFYIQFLAVRWTWRSHIKLKWHSSAEHIITIL